jgi:hypothetical protein
MEQDRHPRSRIGESADLPLDRHAQERRLAGELPIGDDEIHLRRITEEVDRP